MHCFKVTALKIDITTKYYVILEKLTFIDKLTIRSDFRRQSFSRNFDAATSSQPVSAHARNTV